jgi:hypothetical protein
MVERLLLSNVTSKICCKMLGTFIKTSCVYSEWVPDGMQRSETNNKQNAQQIESRGKKYGRKIRAKKERK